MKICARPGSQVPGSSDSPPIGSSPPATPTLTPSPSPSTTVQNVAMDESLTFGPCSEVRLITSANLGRKLQTYHADPSPYLLFPLCFISLGPSSNSWTLRRGKIKYFCKACKKTSNLPGRPREAPHLWWLTFSPQIYSKRPAAQARGKKSSLERNRRLLGARQLQTRAQGCRSRKKVI